MRTPNLATAVTAGLLVAGTVFAQDPATPPKPAEPAVQDPVAQMQELFANNGLVVDPKAGTIRIKTEVGHPDQPLEFLLIHSRGKAHEAMLITEARPSVLNAAFLLLGYKPGENARVVDRDPLPTPDEIAKGAPLFDVFPPKGMPVWFTAKWTRVDADGTETEVEVPIEDLLVDTLVGRPVEDAEWIYLGGQLAPLYKDEAPVFLADYEGNIVSNVYRAPPNQLVTIKHVHADDEQIWWVSESVPRPGTPVELTVHRTKTALHVARDKRIAERKRAEEAEKKGAASGDDAKRKDG